MKCSYRNNVAAISDRQSFWFCNQNEDKHILQSVRLAVIDCGYRLYTVFITSKIMWINK